MKNTWSKLSPKHRRFVVIGAAVAVFAGAIALTPNGSKSIAQDDKNKAVRAILTDRDSGDIRFERLLAQLDNMRTENKSLIKGIERLRTDVERLEANKGKAGVSEEMEDLIKKVEELEFKQKIAEENEGLNPYVSQNPSNSYEEWAPVGAQEPLEEGAVISEPKASGAGQQYNAPDAPIMSPEEKMWNQPPPEPEPIVETRRGGNKNEEAPAPTAIRVIEGVKKEVADTTVVDEGIYLPAGSIITGTLLTGLDAPTFKQAQAAPLPVLVRIKHEAILPNRFRADVRECFAILGGYGELSSERAYFRGETISCVRNDGQVVESSLNSYTVGEDGKAGLRGRLVSKEGQVLAKVMSAGVLEGFANAFNKNTTINFGGEGNQLQEALSGRTLESGALSGAGKTFQYIAEYYLEQANSIFPVIEIDAGRQVDIVLIHGGQLALSENKKGNRK